MMNAHVMCVVFLVFDCSCVNVSECGIDLLSCFIVSPLCIGDGLHAYCFVVFQYEKFTDEFGSGSRKV